MPVGSTTGRHMASAGMSALAPVTGSSTKETGLATTSGLGAADGDDPASGADGAAEAGSGGWVADGAGDGPVLASGESPGEALAPSAAGMTTARLPMMFAPAQPAKTERWSDVTGWAAASPAVQT